MKKYSAYKTSGIEWAEAIPNSWRCCEIAHFTTSKSGGTPDRGKKSYWENGTIPWMSSGEVNKVNVYDTEEHITELGMQMSSAKMLDINTVVIALNGQGKTKAMSAILRIKSTCNQSLCGFKCDERNLHYTYLFYCFQTMYKYLRSQAGDDSRDGISAFSVTKQRIPVPSFDEQIAIAAYLDAKCAKVDNVISVQQKRIELLKELKQSVITNAVTKGLDKNVEFKPSGIEWIGDIPEKWEVGKIKFYSTLHNGDRSSEYPNAKELVDEGVLFLTSNNIHNLILDVSNVQNKYITDEKYKRLGGAKICLNDIVFCLRGSIGNCSINTSISKGTVASSLVVIRPNRINAFFLNYALHSNIVESQTCIAMNGSCAANLSAENVGNYYIAIPPKDVQEHITFYLNKKCSAIDNQISKIERQIELLKEYKQSIITECVTGKRKVC